jgi:hypothetical protein
MRNALIAALLLTSCANAQDPSVPVRARAGLIEKVWNMVLRPRSTVTLSFASGTVDAAGAVTLDISMAASRLNPAALQWDIQHGADVTALTVTAGPAATAAGKTVDCHQLSAGNWRCIVTGTNTNAIAPGVVARAAVQTDPASPASSAVLLLSGVSATLSGLSMLTAIAPGGGVISLPVALSNFQCDKPELEPGEASACTLTLNKAAPPGGLTVALTADDPAKLSVPATATIPAGSSSAPVKVSGL